MFAHTEKTLVGYVGRGAPDTTGTMLTMVANKQYAASELVCEERKYLTIEEMLKGNESKPSSKIVYALPLNYGSDEILMTPSECKDISNQENYIYAIGSFAKDASEGEHATITRAVRFDGQNISYVEVSKSLIQCTYYSSGD